MPYSQMKFYSSLKSQVIILVCLASLTSIVFVSALNYLETSETLENHAIDGLAGEARLVASRFKQAYDTIESDALLLSKTPPIEGLIRSINNKNIDSQDSSTTELWRKRLETIFKSLMTSRLHYTQVRYIGVANDGKELVRVNRNGGLHAVNPEELQPKASEEYFQKGLTLKREEVYFSDVTYNREHGVIDDDLIPTLRVVLPVFNNQNVIFGFIVINIDYPQMLRNALLDIKPTRHTYLVNNDGDYLEYSLEGRILPFEFHESDMPPIIRSRI